MFKKFEEIDAWIRGRNLVKEIYRITGVGNFKIEDARRLDSVAAVDLQPMEEYL